MNEVILDSERQGMAKEYARIRRRLMLVDLVIAALYTILWLVTGWSIAFRNYLYELTANEWLVVAGFMVIFGGIYYLIDFPFGYYSGFMLPHRYGLSTQSLKDWFIDQLKGLFIGGILGLAVIEVIYYLLRISPDLWWLWVGVILLFFNVILANLAPVILFPIFFKFVPLDSEHADLVQRLMDLAAKTGTKVRGVYKFDLSRRTKAANAAMTGLGNTRRIILGDTLINEFTADEIETVLAHELGHHVHHDIPRGILVESVITLGGLFVASLVLIWGVSIFGFGGVSDVAGMPLLALVVGGYGLVTMPLGNAYSRQRERRADEFALRTTGKGAAYASALTRLANQNLAEAEPESWVEVLLYSHPALNKRIKMAENYQLDA
ncbi:MAG: M48 family metallopeptidase [Chloroflexota bacterium]|nr:MAG: M48 family metallopeptidase [Chloroflexota bacterium]